MHDCACVCMRVCGVCVYEGIFGSLSLGLETQVQDSTLCFR